MIGSIKSIKASRTVTSGETEATPAGPAPVPQVSVEEGMLRFLAQRLYLSYDMVLEARAVFERYRALDRDVPALDNLADGKPGERGALAEMLPLRMTLGSEDRIGIAGLRALFSDLGIVQSDIEIVGLIERLSGRVREVETNACETSPLSKPMPKRNLTKQTSPEDQRTLPKRRITGSGNSSREEERRVTNSSAAGTPQQFVAVPPNDISQEILSGCLHPSTLAPPHGLSFFHFLFLLQEDFHEGIELQKALQQQEKEAEEVFREMDVDRNGVLTESDIRQVLARLLTEEVTFQDEETILRLASLHPVELQAALTEFDVDSDGHVTLSDFLSVLRS
ncbi:unnamed protein product [Phytomonas sp. Hart1]|nr:unnamed protein product [Phytomonas sp. Hart1]|eukprot:CCW68296.1 unnamed protein product [Phytomonas sp. isolate Hart1]